MRAFRDEILEEMQESLDIADHASMLTRVERHSRIHTYAHGQFSIDRLRQTLTFAKEHAEFAPELVEISNWPDFQSVQREEVEALKTLATDFGFEVWLTAQVRRDTKHDGRHMPAPLMAVEDLLSVVVALQPEGQQVHLRFAKVHGETPPDAVQLDFDPRKMLLRWR